MILVSRVLLFKALVAWWSPANYLAEQFILRLAEQGTRTDEDLQVVLKERFEAIRFEGIHPKDRHLKNNRILTISGIVRAAFRNPDKLKYVSKIGTFKNFLPEFFE